VDDVAMHSQDLDAAIPGSDCVAIITDHTGTDYRTVVEKASLIIDTRHALKGIKSEKIICL
jgi:UDP-N-acetyl-D-mannosaminuronate dehydrogenase